MATAIEDEILLLLPPSSEGFWKKRPAMLPPRHCGAFCLCRLRPNGEVAPASGPADVRALYDRPYSSATKSLVDIH